MFGRQAVTGLFALAIFACAPMAAEAQTISQPDADTMATGPGVGQSFTATVTGSITRIQVRPRDTEPATLHLYNGVGSGVFLSLGTPAYSQAVSLVAFPSDASSEGFQTIVLDTPFPVVAGNQYTFVMDDALLSIDTTNPYTDGVSISIYSEPDPASDLAFAITEVVPIPTLSEWAMILFGTILAGGAALYIQRRRFTV